MSGSKSENILDYGNENILEFIQNKIKNNNNVKEDILDKIKYVLGEIVEGDIREDHSSQGFYYERLWDLCVKFGATNLTLDAIPDKTKAKTTYLQTSHIINENPNKTHIEFQSNCWNGNVLNKNPSGYLLQPVRSGHSGGYSDITFFNQKYDDKGNKIGEEELYFISVKYFKEEREIAEYDIGKICALIKEHEKKNRIIKLYIFVKDKEKAIKKFGAQHASSNILIKYINPGGKYEHIYDINDLQNSFFKLKKILEQYDYLQSPTNINDFQVNYLNVLKDVFIPRFHQKLFILKINKLIEDGEKNILVGAIPRSGKSYIMAGTILEYIKKQEELHPGKKLKILLMTPAPNETFGEYETIFNKYIEFDKLGIDVITYKDGVNSKKVCDKKDKHCVIIISKQKLGWSDGSNAEKILAKGDQEVEDKVEDKVEDEQEDNVHEDDDKDIKIIKQRIVKLFDANPDIDIMFLDEAHFGMSTDKAQKIVDVLNNTIANTIKIYVTATYNKPLEAYNVKSDCKLTWDMNDIEIMKNISKETINDNVIKQQFGKDIYENTLEYFGDKTGLSLVDKFKKNYAIFPKPYMITSLWDKEFLNVEKLKIGDTEFGWDMNKLFSTVGDSDNFENEEQVKEMMRYYFGYPDKKESYDKQSFYRSRGIMPRIRNICLNRCRTLQPQHKTSQIWFLPVGSGKIKNKVKALINLLTNSNEFNNVKTNYHFFVAVDIEDKTKKATNGVGVTYMNDPHNIKTDIENIEKAMKDGKIKQDNLIILAGQRLQLGISLRNVDIVTLWNSVSSADALFQMLFRSMTEVDAPPCQKNEYCDEKKFGFMVDMNPQRAFTNVNLFSANISKKKDDVDVQKYRQITDLINIDEDVLYDKYGNDEKGRNEFVKELFIKLYASWNINVENIKKIISNFSFDMTKLEALKKVFEKINIDKNKKQEVHIDELGEDEMFETGKKKEKIMPSKKKDKKEKEEKEINLTETATEIISEFISLLNIFTLYLDTGAKCILTDTSKTNEQLTIVDEIETLKDLVYKDKTTKEVFLKILNGRLSGNMDELYPEQVIDEVFDAMNSSEDKQIVNKIIMSQKKQYYTINEPDKLLEFINGELKPKEKEKKENGEVFTPLSLVNEMMNKLDEAYIKENGKGIFTEPSFKWLDPAVGIGNFPVIVYQRLMNGLTAVIKDEEKRRKHILENMIYASELTSKNVYIYKKIFCGDTYKLNIYEGDTLKMDTKKEFKLSEDFKGFDVIMGNPPFQLKVGDRKTQPLWHLFVNYSLKNCNIDGYLLLVHPSGWRSPEGVFKQVKDLIMSKNLKYLSMNDFKKGQETFKVGTNFDFYVLKNNSSKNNITVITDINGKTYNKNITGWGFIPSGGFEEFEKILAVNDEERVDVLYDRTLYGTDKLNMSIKKTDVYRYPCVYTITQRDGVKFFYSSIKHPKTEKKDMFVPKVIWSNGLGTEPIIDSKGEYGLTQFAYAIVDDISNLSNIQAALDSPKFIELMTYVKFQNNKYSYKVISLFKKDFWKKFIDNEEGPEPKSNISFSSDKAEVEEQSVQEEQSVDEEKTVDEEQSVHEEQSVDQEQGVDEELRKKIAPVIEKKPSQTPIHKKKRTIRKQKKLTVTEKKDKIYNRFTKRYIKDTKLNRNKLEKLEKLEKQTLKKGGGKHKHLKKRTIKNKYRQ